MEDINKVSVTVSRRILKYAEGVDPSDPNSTPFDVVDQPIVLVGQEAMDFINSNNISLEEAQ